MPPNTSATGGYLLPEDPSVPEATLEDDAFLDFFHDVIAGVTGLDPHNVRPRWQVNPPTMPGRNVDWVGFGIQSRRPDQTGYEAHESDPSLATNGQTALLRYEDCDVLHSFYGPNAERYATRLRDGLLIGQNREVLTTGSMGVKRFDGPQPAPMLIKEQWLYRTDLTITLRRQIRRVYPVLNIIEGVGVIITDKPLRTTPFSAGA